jgi:hypothetical protein
MPETFAVHKKRMLNSGMKRQLVIMNTNVSMAMKVF